jgi:rubrerythrin
MNCQNGCTQAGYQQEMGVLEAGHYRCPECGHEKNDNDPSFRCTCPKCVQSAFFDQKSHAQ